MKNAMAGLEKISSFLEEISRKIERGNATKEEIRIYQDLEKVLSGKSVVDVVLEELEKMRAWAGALEYLIDTLPEGEGQKQAIEEWRAIRSALAGFTFPKIKRDGDQEN
jgi:predicted RNase H-like nuclease (RuvC/YqgF family)